MVIKRRLNVFSNISSRREFVYPALSCKCGVTSNEYHVSRRVVGKLAKRVIQLSYILLKVVVQFPRKYRPNAH